MISAAAYKSRFEIEQLIAEWAPKLDVPTQVEVVDATAAPGPQETPSLLPPSTACAPARTISPAERTKLEPLAPGRLALHMTITQEMYDDLCYESAAQGRRSQVAQGGAAAGRERLDDGERSAAAAGRATCPAERHGGHSCRAA
jgi:hypothetical protein